MLVCRTNTGGYSRRTTSVSTFVRGLSIRGLKQQPEVITVLLLDEFLQLK